MTHIAIYVRVSTERQDTASQEPDIKRWLTASFDLDAPRELNDNVVTDAASSRTPNDKIQTWQYSHKSHRSTLHKWSRSLVLWDSRCGSHTIRSRS